MMKYLFILLLCLPIIAAADYKYYKTIDTTNIRTPVWVQLDQSILDFSESNSKDIRIETQGTYLPYHLEKIGGVTSLSILSIDASSIQPQYRGTTYSPNHMIDGSPSTFYQNDFSVDGTQTTLFIKLTEIQKLDSMSFSLQATTIKKITVYAMIAGKKTKITESKSSQIKLNSIKTNSLIVQFDHTGTLKITSLNILGETYGRILFEPVSDETRIYYGKANDPGVQYNTTNLYTDSTTVTLATSEQHINPLFVADVDGGIEDNCPNIENPDQTDSDFDGVGDVCDNCIYTQNLDQHDQDSDGVGDLCDNCKYKPNQDQLDKDLDGVGWVCDDDDKDGVTNNEDNCLGGKNPDQQDVDRDGIGDLCEDDDGDGVVNYKDLCPKMSNPSNKDSDGDKLGDECDNCPMHKNTNQNDKDNDGIGDVCEDLDGDSIVDSLDNCKTISNTNQIDWDKDGFGDECDNCPEIKNSNQMDIDGDNIGDVCDSEESRLMENSTFVWVIMIISAIIILGLAFHMRKNN